jgi:hypothetical protein
LPVTAGARTQDQPFLLRQQQRQLEDLPPWPSPFSLSWKTLLNLFRCLRTYLRCATLQAAGPSPELPCPFVRALGWLTRVLFESNPTSCACGTELSRFNLNCHGHCQLLPATLALATHSTTASPARPPCAPLLRVQPLQPYQALKSPSSHCPSSSTLGSAAAAAAGCWLRTAWKPMWMWRVDERGCCAGATVCVLLRGWWQGLFGRCGAAGSSRCRCGGRRSASTPAAAPAAVGGGSGAAAIDTRAVSSFLGSLGHLSATHAPATAAAAARGMCPWPLPLLAGQAHLSVGYAVCCCAAVLLKMLLCGTLYGRPL